MKHSKKSLPILLLFFAPFLKVNDGQPHLKTRISYINLIFTVQNLSTDSLASLNKSDTDFSFFIPNGFTPNNDGINDEFYGKGGFINSFEMRIYDRYGNLIFYTNDVGTHWNGNINNTNVKAQEEIYVFVFNLSDASGNKHKYCGTVSLVR
jgi:gliding motility-associated-like protein